MHQHVLRYECDNCHTVVEVPLPTGLSSRSRVPKDWLHVDGYTNSHVAFKLDLCEKCKVEILKYTEKG